MNHAPWRRPPGVAAGTWSYTRQRSIADRYDDFVADTPLCEVDAAMIAELFGAASRRRGDRLIDLGCGSGRTALPLQRSGYHVVGVDLSQPMLDRLNAKQDAGPPPPGGRRIATVRANLVQLDGFTDRSFDHAICMFSTLGMIQGRHNRRAFLRHVARLVRPGGTFLSHVHNRWAALHEVRGLRRLAVSRLRSWRRRDHEFGDATYPYRGLGNMFMHRFSRREIVTDLRQCGWRIRRVENLSLDGSRRIANPGVVTHAAGGFLVTAECVAGPG